MPQFRRDDFLKLNSRNVMLGTFLFSLGCAQKFLLADPLISDAQHFYNVACKLNVREAEPSATGNQILAKERASYMPFYGSTAIALRKATQKPVDTYCCVT